MAKSKWLFIEKNEDIMPILTQANIPATVLEINRPRRCQGIAFPAEYLDTVLSLVGIVNKRLPMRATDQEVWLLELPKVESPGSDQRFVASDLVSMSFYRRTINRLKRYFQKKYCQLMAAKDPIADMQLKVFEFEDDKLSKLYESIQKIDSDMVNLNEKSQELQQELTDLQIRNATTGILEQEISETNEMIANIKRSLHFASDRKMAIFNVLAEANIEFGQLKDMIPALALKYRINRKRHQDKQELEELADDIKRHFDQGCGRINRLIDHYTDLEIHFLAKKPDDYETFAGDLKATLADSESKKNRVQALLV